MKRTLTTDQIKALSAAVDVMSQVETELKFSYALARNRAHLRPIVAVLDKSIAPKPEFEKGRQALLEELAEHDDKGRLIEIQGRAVIKDMPAFNERLDALKAETGQDKHEKAVAEILEKEEEIEVFVVEMDYFPKKMRGDILEALLPMRADDAPVSPPVALPNVAQPNVAPTN